MDSYHKAILTSDGTTVVEGEYRPPGEVLLGALLRPSNNWLPLPEDMFGAIELPCLDPPPPLVSIGGASRWVESEAPALLAPTVRLLKISSSCLMNSSSTVIMLDTEPPSVDEPLPRLEVVPAPPIMRTCRRN